LSHGGAAIIVEVAAAGDAHVHAVGYPNVGVAEPGDLDGAGFTFKVLSAIVARSQDLDVLVVVFPPGWRSQSR